MKFFSVAGSTIRTYQDYKEKRVIKEWFFVGYYLINMSNISDTDFIY